MKKYHLSLTIEEVRALKNRLVPITPSEYDLETYALLRGLYGRLDHFDVDAMVQRLPDQTRPLLTDPRD